MATTPIITLAIIYMEKFMSSPARKRECFSKAKVEKVVKPPQKPVDNNNVWFCVSTSFLNERPKTIPINKQPMTLTVKVPRKKD